MPRYSCGCVNEVDLESGVLHCIKKCEGHVTWLLTNPDGTRKNYEEMGLLSNGIPQNRRLIDEFLEPLQKMKSLSILDHRDRVLEIGCGLGSYIPIFLRCGSNYEAVESSEFAAYWTENTFGVSVWHGTFQEMFGNQLLFVSVDLIFAAHVLEHMEDAPQALELIHGLLKDDGHLILILPDDSDPTNPGHQWFFTEPTLRALLEQKGFKNIKTTIRKRVDRENFIYCVAEK